MRTTVYAEYRCSKHRMMNQKAPLRVERRLYNELCDEKYDRPPPLGRAGWWWGWWE